VRFGDGSAPAPFAPPALGQHSREILASLGYSEGEIEQLCGGGAVIAPAKRADS
jgi:crotonobetainyl-CoA:carnitine CoA-transferase CaiB-like acyl-CoA transferase